ncbi:hypothetical protein Cgig2_015860 [Carnegiea gigantea]|uniref:Uncharacterized protein n=1 Tax=Carnegiea gigantea TaxID=171969 RepID=A0A9Q1JMH0_9CARY|nr:hypothetical protein Cgig2_015860 [Carnegiea gigantea]
MDEMALYVLGNFEYYRREVVFPPRPLPYDYRELCPNFNLTMVEEFAQDYEVLELPQVVFMSMLLNDDVKLSVLSGWMIPIMESALKELRWNAFQAWTGCNRVPKEEYKFSGRERKRLSLCLQPESWLTIITMAFLPFRETGEIADYIRENFRWHWRSASRPPRPLPEDYRVLCLHFVLSKAEEAACEFELPEMVQATFYAMLLNDAVGLGIVSGFIAADLRASLEGLRWTSFESWMYVNKHDLLEAQLYQQAPPGVARELVNDQEESSGSNDPPPPSSDDE